MVVVMKTVCNEKNCTKKAEVDALIEPSAIGCYNGDERRTVWFCVEHYEQFLHEVMAGRHWQTVGYLTTKL